MGTSQCIDTKEHITVQAAAGAEFCVSAWPRAFAVVKDVLVTVPALSGPGAFAVMYVAPAGSPSKPVVPTLKVN